MRAILPRARRAVFPAYFVNILSLLIQKLPREVSDRTMGWPIVLIVIASAMAVQGQESCLSVEALPYVSYGDKTPYIFANRQLPITKAHNVPGCQPIAIWLLSRHGSNNAEASEISALQSLVDFQKNIIDNYKNRNFQNLQQRMCSADVDELKEWKWNPKHNATFAGDLTSEGYINTQTQAQAFRQKFPGILTDNPHDYMFKFVDDKLSSTTYKAFTEGIFKAQAESLYIPKENDERLVMPYKFCPAWTREVEENNDTLSQVFIFESKREYKEMISNISHRLGFSWDIDKETLMRVYAMCRYNKAWDLVHYSPWCAAFTEEDLKRLEYAEDLRAYYRSGYGITLNAKIGCTLVKDMMNFLTNHVEHGPQQPRALIQFTDAQTILMTLTVLGAHRDAAPLTGDNYHTNQGQTRKWRISDIVPYNANLAAVLYKCTPNGNFQVNDLYQVLFLENEKPLYLENCRVGLCEWSYVKNVFGDVASKCNTDFCSSATSISGVFGLCIALFIFIMKPLVF